MKLPSSGQTQIHAVAVTNRYAKRYARAVSRLRVALIYPPPWKIPTDGHAPDPLDGPPGDFRPGDLDADFFQIPYGLLSLAAQARAAGHTVKILNLSGYAWEATETTLKHLQADVVGLSCWTANRRGVRLVAECVKRYRPSTHVTVGGPHATPLPRQLLTHYGAVDSVVVGEGECTFLDLLSRIERRTPLVDLPGAYVRDGSRIIEGPPRAAVEDLDTLASPHASFATHILMTSRGCPWACTFCGAETSWGRGFRPFSVDRVLEDIEAALAQVSVKQLLVKDDTFTTNRNRVLELCRKIRERGLSFLWSCDTRVDVISEDLVKEMRLAGCERMSLGVESGSPAILKAINKKITVQQIERSAALLRRYGIKARFYMMLGNRGETEETFRETLAFLERAKPDQYLFSCLSIYPGTQDYEEAVGRGWLDAETYFTGTFQELKVPFDAKPDVAALLNDWFVKHRGLTTGYVPGADELREVSARLDDAHPPALVELAEALIEEGELDEAEHILRRALELGYPLPGIIHNGLACIALRRGDFAQVKDELVRAARIDPQHYILLRNAAAAREWFNTSGPNRGTTLQLQVRHDFQLFERTEQPTLPGPLPSNWEDWTSSSKVTLLPNPADPRPEFVDMTAPHLPSSRRHLPTQR
jgi:radical SAM superfamily enzyme YgiQ (UPF0313 family)